MSGELIVARTSIDCANDVYLCLTASADARTAQYGSEVCTSLLQTVSGVHQKGIAWRDIKPSNLICTGNCPAALQLKAVDFASAVRIPSGKTSFVVKP